MEQLVARRAHNPKVISSSLVPATWRSKPVKVVTSNGPFVYRLGRQIFILEIGVRFPYGLQKWCYVHWNPANVNLQGFLFGIKYYIMHSKRTEPGFFGIKRNSWGEINFKHKF